LDYRLVQRNQSPPWNTPQNRYTDSDETVYPGDPARDRTTHSGPVADNNFRDKYDSSFRDKSVSSDRSRDSRSREAAKETIGPSRNHDPRARDGNRTDPTRASKGHHRPPEAVERTEKARGHLALSRLSQNSTTRRLRYYPEPTHSGISSKMEKPLPPPTEAEASGISCVPWQCTAIAVQQYN
jgi:hypothetical protein